MAYLVGNLDRLHSDDSWAQLMVCIKDQITKEDLVKCKTDSSHSIVNMQEGTYYNPEENVWTAIKKK